MNEVIKFLMCCRHFSGARFVPAMASAAEPEAVTGGSCRAQVQGT
jgi:hypothetical protein